MMDIVEFLRSVEWMCHSKMRGLMENDRPHEAATEIERLRKENKILWDDMLGLMKLLQTMKRASEKSDAKD